ncbi:MAG: hypothetical protein JWN78_2538 [Bacteroidota bacterium]|nr:hypothetical protein [Bacteroidota bacterium]
MKKQLQYHLILAFLFVLFGAAINAQTLIDKPAESTVNCDNMVSFGGKEQNKSISLSWRTLSEFDDQSFNVQRSKDGINWDVVGKIKGTGGSLWPVNYCYMDTAISNGTYFYRIKTVAGSYFVYSSIVTIKYDGAPAETNKATIYPNPTKNVIWIKMEQPVSKDTLSDFSIYNTNGDQVYISKLRDNLQKVDLTDYKKGFYYVKIGTQTYKIYKE